MSKVKIKDTVYYSIDEFMNLNNINARKTVYNWVKDGKAIKKNLGSNAYFKMA